MVLSKLLPSIVSHAEDILRGPDPRAIHQLRVFTRRTRAIIGEMKVVLPEAAIVEYKPEFKWLASQTGAHRDLDVFIDRVNEYREAESGHEGGALVAVLEELQSEREVERSKLLAVLKSNRYDALVTNWKVFLEAPISENSVGSGATRTILEVASEQTWIAYRRVADLSTGILQSDEVPIDVIHRFRIASKKLRYMMESFSELYDEVEVGELILLFKSLQDSLGDFHDFDIQRRKLMSLTEQLSRDGRLVSEASSATGRFDECLADLAQAARSAFRDDLRQFTGPRIRASFERLYGGPPVG